MIKHDKCAEFEAKILELEKAILNLSDELQKYYDRLQAKNEENIILMGELDDAKRELQKALV